MTKVLIVDDSPLMRRLLRDIFAQAGDFEVAVARSGEEALAMLVPFAPDVITLDINMPGIDGLTCLDRIMLLRPCPVVMVSSLTAEGAAETLDALALGAVDFIAKPRGAISLEIDSLAPLLIAKVRAAAAARIPRTTRLAERVRATASGTPLPRSSAAAMPRTRAATAARDAAVAGLVLVGCSTGGPPALDAVLGALPGDFPWPIVIAQHMPASFTGALARRLDTICALSVCEVSQATPLLPGHAYIGRGDADLIVSRRTGTLVALSAPSDPARPWHPSVDRLVASAADLIPPDRIVGVLMTGMGNDGAAALAEVHARGAHVIAESAATAVVWGMPGALVAAGGASETLPLGGIAPALVARFAT